MADTFHSNIPDFSKFMKSLDLLDENVSKAAVKGIKKGADIIVNAQKRRISAKSQRLADAVSKGTIYTTKKGSVGISTDKRIMLKDLIPQYSTIHIGNYSKLIERNPDIPQQALDMNNVSDTVKIVKGISRRECNVS